MDIQITIFVNFFLRYEEESIKKFEDFLFSIDRALTILQNISKSTKNPKKYQKITVCKVKVRIFLTITN